MERTYIKDLKQAVGSEVLIKGFVHALRDQGGIIFLVVRDVSGMVQVVAMKKDTEVFGVIKELTRESVVEVTGLVKEEKQAPDGIEIQAKTLLVLAKADPELPIPVDYEKGGEETEAALRFDWRWLDLRKSEKLSIFKVWTELEKGFRSYFEESGYLQVYSPSFMGTASESGAEVFEVTYFDRKAYLAQSPQFYKQMAMSAGFERVFIMGPVFRAEPSFTTRHMTEFTGWDFELSYISSHHDVMTELEKVLVAGFAQVKAANLPGVSVDVPSMPFPRITMTAAKEKLQKAGVKSDKSFDINSEEEKELCRIVKEETGSDFVFIIDWPIEGRAFYHMRHTDKPTLTKSFDLLYRGVEIVTGAQREHRYDVLVSQAREKGMELSPLNDYLNFFKYGCPPHGGVGIGPGRIVMKMLDLASVKEATFIPRDVKRLRP